MAARGDPNESRPPLPATLLLLGAGELGKELAISAQRLGVRIVAADRYPDAPAMQVAHASEVLSLVDGAALEGVIRTHRPDLILPELEAVSVATLRTLEAEGYRVVPSAEAAGLVADRTALREVATGELGLRAPRAMRVGSPEELEEACDALGYPVVVKPPTGSSGRGQSVVTGAPRAELAWRFAVEESESEEEGVVVEEFVDFSAEVTLLALRERSGEVRFLPPIAHRQDRGGYRESWTPVTLDEKDRATMEAMARILVDRLGGPGIVGLEFFLTEDGPVFSEISLGPHDTGFVTLVSQDLSQFDLHLRAILGLPIPEARSFGPAASAVILADREGAVAGYGGVERALQVDQTEVRIFGKSQARPFRRMGVALATGSTVDQARARALEAAARVRVIVR